MSFALYGPIATFTKTYTGYNEVALHLAGDKILMYLQGGANPWSLYSLIFNHIRTLHTARDFCRIYNLSVHRLGKNPEVYTGYGSYSPRCTGFTCSAELERYTYGSDITDLLCPGEICYQGNVYDIYYDVVSGKLLVGTGGDGNQLYMIDPDTKEVRKWKARNSASYSHFYTTLYPDGNYIYVFIKRYPQNGGSFEIRRYTVKEFYDNFGVGSIEDYGEQFYYEATSGRSARDRRFSSRAPYGKELTLWNYSANVAEMINMETKMISVGGWERLLFGKYAVWFRTNGIEIIDRETMSVVQVVSYPAGRSLCPGANNTQTQSHFCAFYDANNIYWYLITYNGVVPVIQYDHVNRRFRIVDFITGNVLNGEVWIWRSRFCYHSEMIPVFTPPETLVVNDWTPVPSALKTECLTFRVKNVQTGS